MVEYKGKLTKVNGELRKEISELKLTEKKLRESDGKYRKLMETANDAIFVVDTETGIILDANKQAEVLLGIPVEEIIGMHYTKIHPVGKEKYYKKLFEKYAKIDKSITSEDLFAQHKDGRKIPVEISTSVFETGGKKMIQGIFRDITERKKAEKRLKAQFLVTWVLAEAITIKDAFSKILETICTALEWDIGEIWIIDQQENVLRNAEIWHIPSIKIPEFKAITKQITFPLQIGLPGRVWECAQPLWIEDVVRDANFRRASVAAKEGVHGAFGFPILSGSEVLGTINFFSHELKHPDKYLLDMMSAIGIQIGLFIKRKQAEELLHVQKKALEQKNIALSEILGQVELEKKQIKDNVLANAENLLLPIIQKLRLTGESRKYVQLLRENLQELTSSFGTRLTEREAKLTSREVEICNMIKNGLSSKEIANLLNTSLRTAEKHRANIRKNYASLIKISTWALS